MKFRHFIIECHNVLIGLGRVERSANRLQKCLGLDDLLFRKWSYSRGHSLHPLCIGALAVHICYSSYWHSSRGYGWKRTSWPRPCSACECCSVSELWPNSTTPVPFRDCEGCMTDKYRASEYRVKMMQNVNKIPNHHNQHHFKWTSFHVLGHRFALNSQFRKLLWNIGQYKSSDFK